jgi:hypothetical protein
LEELTGDFLKKRRFVLSLSAVNFELQKKIPIWTTSKATKNKPGKI